VTLLADEAAGGFAQRIDTLLQRRALAEPQLERPSRGAERLVDAGQHPAEADRTVGRE
jgi:hypothetical protein